METRQDQQQRFERDPKAQALQNKVDEIAAIIALPPQQLLGDATPPMAPFHPSGLEDELATAAKALHDYKKEHYPLLLAEDE